MTQEERIIKEPECCKGCNWNDNGGLFGEDAQHFCIKKEIYLTHAIGKKCIDVTEGSDVFDDDIGKSN